MLKFKYMEKNECMAEVEVDLLHSKVKVTNYTDDLLDTPFGVEKNPDMEDLEAFLEDRVAAKIGVNSKLWKPRPDLDTLIRRARRGHGQIWEDFNWILFEGETIDYNDIKLRD